MTRGRPGPAPARQRLAGLILVLAGAVAAGLMQAASVQAAGWWLRAAAAAAAAAVLPLAVRDRYPLAAFAGCGGLWALTVALSVPTPAVACVLIALYAVAVRRGRAWSLACAAAMLAGIGLWIGLTRPDRLAWQAFVLPAAIVAATWLTGDYVRIGRAYLAELRARADRAEADRDAEAQRAAELERARIARELHDVVAHHVSVIAVQAGAARMHGDQHPAGPPPREALAAIEEASRQALAELRRLLGVLRCTTPGPEPGLDLAPPPGLRHLDELVKQVRAAGLPAKLEIRGMPSRLPEGADLSAYRIIQEALTNVLKHQGRVPTLITVTFTADGVCLEVTGRPGGPAGPGTARQAGGGQGLIGMRERVAMLGGDLRAAPLPDGGFSVRALIPAPEPR